MPILLLFVDGLVGDNFICNNNGKDLNPVNTDLAFIISSLQTEDRRSSCAKESTNSFHSSPGQRWDGVEVGWSTIASASGSGGFAAFLSAIILMNPPLTALSLSFNLFVRGALRILTLLFFLHFLLRCLQVGPGLHQIWFLYLVVYLGKLTTSSARGEAVHKLIKFPCGTFVSIFIHGYQTTVLVCTVLHNKYIV